MAPWPDLSEESGGIGTRPPETGRTPGELRAGPLWSREAGDLFAELGSRPDGLSSAEAADRVLRFGPNRTTPAPRFVAARLLARQFGSPLMLLLGVAAGLSIGVGAVNDAVIILVLLVLSGALGFSQEYASSNTVAKLVQSVATRSTVRRDQKEVDLTVADIVPGDVVLLSAGSLVPADGIIVQSKDLFVDEASLTGESYPAEKHKGAVPADTPFSGRTGAVFAGTHVVSGTASVLVVATGRGTEFSKIAHRLRVAAPRTDFDIGIQRFGLLILWMTITMVLIVFAANVYFHRPILESFMFSLALAVGLVPELLPAIVTVNLARGATRMARSKVIVKRLTSIESFGTMDVLCTDKTGTLTEAEIQLTAAHGPGGNDNDEVRLLGGVNARFETGLANAMDNAIRASTSDLDYSAFAKLDEIPYDFMRKRMSVLVSREADSLLITKGAFAGVIDVCTQALVNGATVPISDVKKQLREQSDGYGQQGLRALAVAIRSMSPGGALATSDETDMTFVGFLVFSSPVKPGILETLGELRRLGINLKMLTGDSALVARTVAQAVGIERPNVITGPHIHNMRDEALARRVGTVDVFAEVEPNQKERIVVALKKSGNAVGFLGDGINDAPALHSADVGISVDSAVDVAREAASIVLMEKDLQVLVDGVREGRRTFTNTLKYIFITSSANFGNMVSVAVASLFLSFLPLLPTQILLNNVLSDIPALTIAGDRVDPEQVVRPRRWDIRFIRDFMIVFGSISSAFDFLMFGVLALSNASIATFRTGWFLESLLTELAVLLLIRTRRAFFRSVPSRPLVISSIAVGVGTLALLYTPIRGWFEFDYLPIPLLAAVIGLTIGYAVATELAKHWFYRRHPA